VRNGRVRAGLLGAEHTTVERGEFDEDEQLLVAARAPDSVEATAVWDLGTVQGVRHRHEPQTNSGVISYPYRCSRLPRCSCRALFSVAYIAERDRPLMSISCAALYSPDS